MPIADVFYQNDRASEDITSALVKGCRTACTPKAHLVLLMVGVNTSTGDSLGPFVGWFLKRRGLSSHIIGCLDAPVHATNLKERTGEGWVKAMSLDKYPYIVAVDAAVGRPGWITVNKGPLEPGKGMGKTLPTVGDLHIMGGTAAFPELLWVTGLDQTVAMAEVISNGLYRFAYWWRARQRAMQRDDRMVAAGKIG